MGEKGVGILGSLDVKDLIRQLNEALSEEWLAYYQYWIGARLIEGPMRTEVEPELLTHADEELNHAVMVVDRIIQLGGDPVIHPEEWFKLSRCAYEAPSDPYIEAILKQNLSGEQCAIKRYKEIADYTHGKDHTTWQIATNILNDELEHEQDIEDWLNDLKMLKDDLRKLKL